MTNHLLSLGIGFAVGIAYGALGVRSPAPPVIALLGLLGMLVGEQVAPIAKRWLAGERLTLGAIHADCAEHLFGALPGRRPAPQTARTTQNPEPPA